MTVAEKTGTLMLIDDNCIDQMMHERIIKRSGLVDSVSSFNDATDALQRLKTGQTPMPDIILLDINMPCMDGFEFLEALSGSMKFIEEPPVVFMLTTSMDEKDKARAASFDLVKGYCVKPLTPEDLERVVCDAHSNH